MQGLIGGIYRSSNPIIRSIQYGSITMSGTSSGTAIITAVTVAKSFLIPLGWSTDNNDVRAAGRFDALTSTVVTANRGTAVGVTQVNFVVVEFTL